MLDKHGVYVFHDTESQKTRGIGMASGKLWIMKKGRDGDWVLDRLVSLDDIVSQDKEFQTEITLLKESFRAIRRKANEVFTKLQGRDKIKPVPVVEAMAIVQSILDV